jgi:tripartite-type tricarboxylate transporter receptor subunit TctC
MPLLGGMARLAASAFVIGVTIAAPAAVVAYPERPVTIIVAWPAGGATDLMARGLQDTFQSALGAQVIIKNVVGAAGTIGATEAARASPDGYTLLISPIGPIVIQPQRMKITYSADSFDPVCKLVDSPVILMGTPESRFKGVADLVAAAKSDPGKIAYGSSGPGTIPHMSKIAFAKAAGIDIKHVPYKGSADVIQGMLSNTVELFTDQPNLVTQYNLKPLAVYAESRISTFKDVPTMKEAGYDLQFSIWSAMFAPKGTPDAVLGKLEAACRTTMADPKVVEIMERQRQPIDFRDRKGLGAFVAAEFKKAGELIDAAGLRPK